MVKYAKNHLFYYYFTLIILTGCSKRGFIPENNPDVKKLRLGEKVEDKEEPHRYGRPFEGWLFWEDDPRFISARNNSNTYKRLGAFSTTLPDPLPGEEYNVALAADLLSGTVVQPGEVFSMNKKLGPYRSERGYKQGPTYMGTRVVKTVGGGVCKVATTLYNVAILANLQIVLRYPHGMLVPYVPEGQDATVAEGARDFRFKNNTGRPLLIWSDTKGNTLYIAFYGRKTPPKITWQHQIIKRQKTWLIRRHNPNLSLGQQKEILAGSDGMAVKSWIKIKYDNRETVTKYLGIDYYKPMPRVVEYGPRN